MLVVFHRGCKHANHCNKFEDLLLSGMYVADISASAMMISNKLSNQAQQHIADAVSTCHWLPLHTCKHISRVKVCSSRA